MTKSKKEIVIGLKKARSTIDKILQMVESASPKNDDRCFDVIQQNLAVIGLLKSTNIAMMENHLDVYIDKNARTPRQKRNLRKMKEEIIKIVHNAQK